MQSLNECVGQYKALLEKGDNFGVIDTFYDEQIVQVENDEAPIVGKQHLRQLEAQNGLKVFSCRQKINTLIIDQSQHLVMGEMTIRFNSKQLGSTRLDQAFMQRWHNGRIIFQRFYYQGFVPDDNQPEPARSGSGPDQQQR